ncbi:hypothetical protein [Cyclobacterium sp.]|uniref:hypothetical protein n=1 Tax=Cyclobacterium sp. TaxID=1966343 RepID=UPI0019C39103|nr:hypothetical protein [Cyclobacterium sp.]MBD3627576.1 hypothetical protein [Cyclobacterium sp.]
MKIHDLYLSMYVFQIKKHNTADDKTISSNDFMALAYPDFDNPFLEGFTQELVSSLEEKAYKSNKGTHGGILEDKKIRGHMRMVDIMINGGITGIKQVVIDEKGEKRELSEKEIVGMKFYFRVWLPTNGNLGYVFVQSYNTLSIKDLVQDIVESILKKHGHRFSGGRMLNTTTKKRQKDFLKKASLKHIVVLSNKNANSTSFANAGLLELTLKNVSIHGDDKLDFDEIKKISKAHGILLKGKNFVLKGKYELPHGKKKEIKTVPLSESQDNIKVVPNVKIPNYCIGEDNYPNIDEMIKFVDNEIDQIKRELKK